MNPTIIQGGMGIGVSDYRLARAVASAGQLGVVSGTALDQLFVRRLEEGDRDGALRRALSHYPNPATAQAFLDRFWIDGGKATEAPYTVLPLWGAEPNPEREALTVVANFVEVFLAKEGHAGIVGINLLEKLQIPTLPSLLGAMLAGVDVVLMGAGIPREIPAVLDALVSGSVAELTLHVSEASAGATRRLRLDPTPYVGGRRLRRPRFFPIVASVALATTLVKKAKGGVDGLIVEGHAAGGHNAPPRGPARISTRGEPVYGEKDEVDLEKIRALGVPFWLAGSIGTPEGLERALARGAAGIQVGSAFALCDESGMSRSIKDRLLSQVESGRGEVFTDPRASPTGFPFKVVRLSGTLSESACFEARPRNCDLGYLRQPYEREDGSLGYRCPAESSAAYVSKGGTKDDSIARKCLCNGLFATIGLGQRRRHGTVEPPIVTAGSDLRGLAEFLVPGRWGYTACDVLSHLLGADERAPYRAPPPAEECESTRHPAATWAP